MLNKKELLAPAGDMESLKAAIHAGADAVYLGGKRFGARRFSPNFSHEELKIAVDYAHLYGVKVYVTVNTMIYEREMEDAYQYAKFLSEIGVDALIVQDIGFIRLLHIHFPELELHASTQLHNYTKNNFDELARLGVKRVVLARESSLSEIESISTPLEKEVFIHGAICISYSGQCLFSSLVLGRSGNRGECAGMCRLPFTLEKADGKILKEPAYLLSPKDLCTVSKFKELMDSDIKSFKIEGRMKSATYVYLVVKIYRYLMDAYDEGKEMCISDTLMKQLKTVFHRGFTLGHLFEDKENFRNTKGPNHQGIVIGQVKSVDKKRIELLLTDDLYQEDGIRFSRNQKGMIVNFLYDRKGNLISSGKRGDTVFLDNKVSLEGKSDVVKTSSKYLDGEILNYPQKKISVDVSFRARVGEVISLSVTDGVSLISVEGPRVEKAKSCATSREDIEKHLSKLGDTPYQISKLLFDIDNDGFIPMKVVNHLRQEAVLKLNEARFFRKPVKAYPFLPEKYESKKEKNVTISCLVRTEEQLLACLNSACRIYVTNPELYFQYKEKYPQLYLRLDRGKESPDYVGERLLLTEISQLFLASKNQVVADYYLNVANHYFLSYLKSRSILCSTLSVEAKLQDIEEIPSVMDMEVIVYGNLEVMLIKNGDFLAGKYLIDRNKEKYPIFQDDEITHLFSYQKEWFSESEVLSILSTSISSIRLEFLEESSQEVKNVLKKYQEMLANFSKL